jgi:hypothetical protein
VDIWFDVAKPKWFSRDGAVFPHDFLKDLVLTGMTWKKVPGSPIKYNIEEYMEKEEEAGGATDEKDKEEAKA